MEGLLVVILYTDLVGGKNKKKDYIIDIQLRRYRYYDYEMRAGESEWFSRRRESKILREVISPLIG